jgi:hypothetical protein
MRTVKREEKQDEEKWRWHLSFSFVAFDVALFPILMTKSIINYRLVFV